MVKYGLRHHFERAHAPELERKLLVRVKQFSFGAREVDVMVVTYPIDFLPS